MAWQRISFVDVPARTSDDAPSGHSGAPPAGDACLRFIPLMKIASLAKAACLPRPPGARCKRCKPLRSWALGVDLTAGLWCCTGASVAKFRVNLSSRASPKSAVEGKSPSTLVSRKASHRQTGTEDQDKERASSRGALRQRELGSRGRALEQIRSVDVPPVSRALARGAGQNKCASWESWEDHLVQDLRDQEHEEESALQADAYSSTHDDFLVDQISAKMNAVVEERERRKRAEMMKAVQWRESRFGMSVYINHIFGIGPALAGLESSRLVHPYSPFAKAIAIMSSVFLLYTALVTPVILCFHWNAAACWVNPFLRFDIILDSFFLLEIVYNCCLGAYINGVYVDELKPVVLQVRNSSVKISKKNGESGTNSHSQVS